MLSEYSNGEEEAGEDSAGPSASPAPTTASTPAPEASSAPAPSAPAPASLSPRGAATSSPAHAPAPAAPLSPFGRPPLNGATKTEKERSSPESLHPLKKRLVGAYSGAPEPPPSILRSGPNGAHDASGKARPPNGHTQARPAASRPLPPNGMNAKK
eukprot:tig00021073_g18007.t1